MKVVAARVASLSCAVLVVLSVAGCQSKSGAAAVVGGQRIAESDVADYLGAQAPDTTGGRQFVLTYLVKTKLYENILGRRGGVPAAATLTGYHDTAVDQILSSQLGTGAAADALIGKVLTDRGIKTSLVPVIVRSVELEWATFQNLKVAGADFFPAVAKYKIPVSVSPRYGSWDGSRQDLVNPVTPSFLAPVTSPADVAPAGGSTAPSAPATP